MTSDANALMAAARCYKCLSPGTLPEVQIYLLSRWANVSCPLPMPPSDLGAFPGNNQVTLTWPGTGPLTLYYNIYRSLTPGGPYALINDNDSSPFIDLTAVNGTKYYYVVKSVNACGESVNSSLESSATPPGVGSPCGTPSDFFSLTGSGMGASIPASWINATPTKWIPNGGSWPASVQILLVGGTWNLYLVPGVPLYQSTVAQFPCTWTTTASGIDPPPTGQYQ